MSDSASYEIRSFEPSLQAQAAAVAEDVLCREFGVLTDLSGEDDLRDIAAAYREPASRFLVALLDGRVVATAGVLHLSGEDCELKRLYVLADHRRKGVASALVAQLIAFVRERGYQRILLEVSPEMRDTIESYARYGFLPVEPSDTLPRAGEFLAIRL